MKTSLTRRQFLASTAAALAAGPLAAAVAVSSPRPRRIGAVAYAFTYSIGLFKYQNRPGERMDVLQFVEATHAAGGNVAQLYFSMIDNLDETALRRLRDRARELDVLLEVHGGIATRPTFEKTLRTAAIIGANVVGCSFGMMLRPDKIATLTAWDDHVARSRARLKELAAAARPLGLRIAVENHLDFTTRELREFIESCGEPNVGVLLDVGNPLGTIDDPLEAADILGPLVIATHYKDFAVVENAGGFQLTMVPLGSGSLQLPAITERLLQRVSPEVAFSIEMINGQQLQVDWLAERFWTAFRDKTPAQVAATLRHIRSKEIVRADFIPQSELEKLPHEAHVKLERERITRCIASLKKLVTAALLTCGLAFGASAADEPCFQRTRVIGYSQVGNPPGHVTVGGKRSEGWFVAGGHFESIVGNDRWELLWMGGAGVDRWRDPQYAGWSRPLVSPCPNNAPVDRVLLSVSGPYGTNVHAWVKAIEATIVNIRQKIPTARQIVLQAVAGGPGGKPCPIPDGDPTPNAFGGQIRASWQQRYIVEAIQAIVKKRAGDKVRIVAGVVPQVRTCEDYCDAVGHLTPEGAAAVGKVIGQYYAQLDENCRREGHRLCGKTR